ncbi:histone-lysine N-methyltransferase SETMAR [Trichonephila clavipes]|nr:histone-lysine N-methyltransferase SETMAR [Trichonephila clavipes]
MMELMSCLRTVIPASRNLGSSIFTPTDLGRVDEEMAFPGRASVISDALLQRTEKEISALGHYLGGKSFHDDDEIKEEVEMWFRQQAATFYDCGIQKLVHRLNKCLDNGGDLVKKL